ncbi:hypothetical protein BAMY6614_13345 [Bacillus amyloliquefaciens UMAF6614]|nr:hypothetical protein BAMY6614_13345 [Bacillus amyloliquefaciens UMAF6614]
MKGIPTLPCIKPFLETRLFGIQNKENDSKVIFKFFFRCGQT